MQGKVSMVMPCYNKVNDISEMFDSIIAQEWDNIELILVNDGSTDGTRDIIAAYEPKFRVRGFEVMIVDQENAGVCAAAVAGLKRITGEYVCMVDADDELDTTYVSTMAGWLEENPDYEMSACDSTFYTGYGKDKQHRIANSPAIDTSDPKIVERYLLLDLRPTVWVYMVRASYFRKCGIVDTYFTQTKGSHEPGYIIPLLANRGKLKFFPLPLYHFNINGEGHSRSNKFERQRMFHEEYARLCHIAIDALPQDAAIANRKEALKRIANVTKCRHIHRDATIFAETPDIKEAALRDLIDTANLLGIGTTLILYEQVQNHEIPFTYALLEAILGRQRQIAPPKGRVIGYAALGKIAARILPDLQGTPLEPTELWDINGDSGIVQKPDFTSLTADDTVVMLSPKRDVAVSVQNVISQSGGGRFIPYSQVTTYIAQHFFPQLFAKY